MLMNRHNYLTSLALSARCQVEVEIQYDFEPYIPGWFGPDGGEPPWGPEINIRKVYVIQVTTPNILDRKWLVDRDYLNFVDYLVWNRLEDLREDLINNAEAEE
jgi:hypothetical protein